MDYKVLIRLHKPEPGQSWAVGEVVTDKEFEAAGLTAENIKGMIAVNLIEAVKKVKHVEI